MPAKRRKQPKATLKYPKHALQPTDLLHFVYLDGFEEDCAELGLNEVDIEGIEICIMAGGKDSPVIPNTGGLRKMRFAPEKWNCGKSAAARVCFVFFQEFWTVLLVTAYRKSEFDDLSEEAKGVYRKLIREIEAAFERRQRIRTVKEKGKLDAGI